MALAGRHDCYRHTIALDELSKLKDSLSRTITYSTALFSSPLFFCGHLCARVSGVGATCESEKTSTLGVILYKKPIGQICVDPVVLRLPTGLQLIPRCCQNLIEMLSLGSCICCAHINSPHLDMLEAYISHFL
jgi:hypothetical protein